jgi:hypothetical protein
VAASPAFTASTVASRGIQSLRVLHRGAAAACHTWRCCVLSGGLCLAEIAVNAVGAYTQMHFGTFPWVRARAARRPHPLRSWADHSTTKASSAPSTNSQAAPPSRPVPGRRPNAFPLRALQREGRGRQ